MNRPQPDEYSVVYQKGYIDTVGDDLFGELTAQQREFPALLRSIAESSGAYFYAEGKWSIKTLAGHVIDTERIMTYRALRIARGDNTPLPGFEENDYAAYSNCANRTLDNLAEEFSLLRNANLFFFRSLTDAELLRTGTASAARVSVRALLFIIAGHVNHHCNILNERYLPGM